MKHCAYQNNRGFTLIELSLVLVIIGLIAGGVLVGRDLIEAAKIRAQVSQIVHIKTAIATFRSKYGYIPGDIPETEAAEFGFTERLGTQGHGDGDQALEACGSYTGISGAEVFGCEVALFWSDLSAANLIEGNYSSASDALLEVPAGQQSQYFPPAKLENGHYLSVFHSAGVLPGWSCLYAGICMSLRQIIRTDVMGGYFTNEGITPVQAYAIDSKMDDGVPNAGRVVGGNGMPGAFNRRWLYIYYGVSIYPETECLVNNSGVIGYALANAQKTVQGCAMNINL